MLSEKISFSISLSPPIFFFVGAVLSIALFSGCWGTTPADPYVNSTTGDLVFHDGYATNPVDKGRPVKLIAAALGVEEQVFRDAFSGVTPAHGRGPTGAEAQANKKVLMDALGPHGITNERLDEVSNYYRYRPQEDELWKHTAAQANAVMKDGEIVSIEISEPGSGYMEPPTVTIKGHEDVKLKVELSFGKDLVSNGSVKSIEVVR